MNLAIIYHDACCHTGSHRYSNDLGQDLILRLRALIDSATITLQSRLIDRLSLYVTLGYQPDSPLALDVSHLAQSIAPMLEASPFPVQIMPLPSAPAIFNPWHIVRELDVDLVYFAESQKIHRPDAVSRLLYAHSWGRETLYPDLVVTPYQDPAIPMDTQLLQARDRHNTAWRAVPQAGRSLLLSKGLVERFREVFEYDGLRFASGRQETTNDLQPIFRLVPCIAPESALVDSGTKTICRSLDLNLIPGVYLTNDPNIRHHP